MKQKLFLLLTVFAITFSACKKADSKEEQPANDSIEMTSEVPEGHTSNIAVDWEGEYKGIIPCEDCDGVETSLILNYDSTFTMTKTYIGKGGPYESKGSFSRAASGNIIVLKFDDASEAKYQLGDGSLSLLNDDGSIIEGEDYVLRR